MYDSIAHTTSNMIYHLIRDMDTFKLVSINPDLPVFCDTETCIDEGLSDGGLYGRVRLFQIFQEGMSKAIIIDCFFIPLLEVLSLLKPHHLVFHNASYDLHTINLKTSETWLPRKLDDTLYLSRIYFCTKEKFGYHECLSHAGLDDELIRGIDKKEEQKSDWSKNLSTKQKIYAASDVTYLCLLYNRIKSCSDSMSYNLDIVNLEFSIHYSRNGMPVNQVTVTNYIKEYTNRLEFVMESLPVNPASSKQCKEYLGTKKSDKDTLDDLILRGDDRAKDIKEARHCLKTLVYLKGYDRPLIKGFFNPCAAITGRFSCKGGDSFSHHNLQQIPGKLHDIVEAPPGYVIIYKDYSGLELRMAVAYTGEPAMGDLMRSGSDQHSATAMYIFNKEDITELERDLAKIFNFNLIYGGGVRVIQKMLWLRAGIKKELKEVKALKERWFDMFAYFRTWHEMTNRKLKQDGYVDIVTALGRRIRAYRYTDALNFPIQGSSVEVTKISLGLLKNRYPDNHLIDTIHDANILLSPIEEAEMWGNRLSECMVEAWYYVTKDLADPTIPMPHGFDSGPIWTFH
jgi:DNA polymerase-1